MSNIINWVKRNPVQVTAILIAVWAGLQVFEVIETTDAQTAWVSGFIALVFGVPAAARSNFGRDSTGGWFSNGVAVADEDYGD